MHIFVYLVLIPITVFFTACEYFWPFPLPVGNNGCIATINNALLYENAPDDPYVLDTAFVSGDCLNTIVTYGGGCGNARFSLHFDGAIMESFPPQARIKLAFRDEDNCKALIREEHEFDLSLFKDTGSGGNAIILRLEGYDGELIYEW